MRERAPVKAKQTANTHKYFETLVCKTRYIALHSVRKTLRLGEKNFVKSLSYLCTKDMRQAMDS